MRNRDRGQRSRFLRGVWRQASMFCLPSSPLPLNSRSLAVKCSQSRTKYRLVKKAASFTFRRFSRRDVAAESSRGSTVINGALTD